MKRVASLYLPEWPLDRLRRAGRVPQPEARPQPNRRGDGASDALGRAAAAERAGTCSVPNTPEGRPGALWAQEEAHATALSREHQGGNPGWRPGARWAKARLAEEVERLPLHQRPPMREMGRRSEPADHPFKAMPPDEAGATIARARGRGVPCAASPGEGPRPGSAAEGRGPYPGEGRFFMTGRMTGGAVGRVWEDAPSSGGERTARRSAELPAVTAHRVGGRDLIAAANRAARAWGVAPGMWLSQARVMVAGLHILPADPQGDRADLLRLAVALARRWAPTVTVSDETGLFVDLTGVAHLHGGEEVFAGRLVRLLDRLGYHAYLAIADTPGAAWAFSRRLHQRYAAAPRWGIVPPGAQSEALAPLPVEALRLEAAHLELLRRLGVDTIGELARLPRAPLARRFGGALVRRLDQATGRAPEPLEPVTPPQRIAVTQRFFEPIATAPVIEHWLDELAPRLAMALAEAGLGARSVLLAAERVDGRTQSLRIGLARPSRSPDHILRLLRRRIEEIDPGFGIDALSLHVLRAEPLGPEALGPALAGETPPDLAPLVDLLANRIGERRLWRMLPVESDVPERAVTLGPPLAPTDESPRHLREDDVRRLQAAEDDHPWHPRWPRPARLLSRPEPVEHVLAELPDQPPKRFTWRGERYHVVRADGPERIVGEWWRRPAERDAVRDYFSVEDDRGRRFWLFRRGDGVRAETGDLSWHLHGAHG